MKKPIVIVGEAWGSEESRVGKPFVGPSGQVLFGMLRQAGISRDDIFLTNVFNFRPPGNNLNNLCGPKTAGVANYRPLSAGKYVRAEYQSELDRLFEEIRRADPNVILALGNTPLWALTKKTGIKRYRGAPLPTFDGRWKVLPTWHPSAILRQWELRSTSIFDLEKTRKEALFPEIRRPVRYIHMEPTIEDIKEFYYKYLQDQPFLSCDIETKGQQITEVGYSTADGKRAIVIPFWKRASKDGNYWPTLEEEREAWWWVRYINKRHELIGQNFSYDMAYFLQTMGIPCPKFYGDTMLMHHSMQPEIEKGLGFLGSIYTNEPSWKFMRTDHSTLKQEDD